MDRRTYELLSQRVDYLELVCAVSRVGRGPSSSYLAQISKLTHDLDRFIDDNCGEVGRVIEILRSTGLWSELDVIETGDDSVLAGVDSSVGEVSLDKQLVVESTYDYLKQLIGVLTKIQCLDGNDIIRKRFKVEVLEYKLVIEEIHSVLVGTALPEKYNQLVLGSINYLDRFVAVVTEYNEYINKVRGALMDQTVGQVPVEAE